MKKILVFGNGWLGNKIRNFYNCILGLADITNQREIAIELDKHKPEVVVNAAGKTGRPNVDDCETDRIKTYSSNVAGPILLLKACKERGIKIVQMASGCIFDGPAPRESGFNERDLPNPVGLYGRTKAASDQALIDCLPEYPKILIVRLRMPIDGVPHQRNLITKLVKYSKEGRGIIDVENSVSVVNDLIEAVAKLIDKDCSGVFNVVNAGVIKHRELLEMYRQFVEPGFTYQMIPASELKTPSGRSNCKLDISKLERRGIVMRSVREAVGECLERYRLHLGNSCPGNL